MATRTITVLPPTLHPGQHEVFNHPARFRVLACGRRWGKTLLATLIAMEAVFSGKRVWWVAPTTTIAMLGWRELISRVGSIATYKNETHLVLRFPGGGEIWFKSTDKPDNLRGDSLDLVIFDEAAFVKDGVWDYVISPMLGDRLGKAVLISTPNGIGNYFHKLWAYGQDPLNTEYKSWQMPTSTNPYFPKSELERIEKETPDIVWKQEWLADFGSDGASVFRNIDEICVLNPQKVAIDTYYIAGLDWGVKNDYTVLSVFNARSREQVYMERTNKVSFDVQYALIKAACDNYNIKRILVEENSIGMSPLQELVKLGLPVQPFQTTNATKQDIVTQMVYAMDSFKIKLLKDPVLINELKRYEAQRLPSGTWRYAAAGKGHDDTVMATMLAVSLLSLSNAIIPSTIATSVQQSGQVRKNMADSKYRGSFYLSHGFEKEYKATITRKTFGYTRFTNY